MTVDFRTLPIIILAAGDSQRMGIPKGLLDYHGKPFFSYQIESLFKIGFTDIVIVSGKDTALYQENIPELKELTVIVNPRPERGPFSSIQCGLIGLKDKCRSGVFILPLDVPCPSKEVWNQLAAELSSSKANVTIPEFKGKRGHPVLLSDEFKQHLQTCSSDSRLDYEIRKQKELQKAKIISVNDKNITLNLNTLEEWEAFKVKE